MSDFTSNFWSVYVTAAVLIGIVACLIPSWANTAEFPGGRDDPEIVSWWNMLGEDLALERMAAHPKAYVVDFSAVPVIDSTAAATIDGFIRKADRHGVQVVISGARQPVLHVLLAHGVRPPRVVFEASFDDAVALAHALAASSFAD